MPKLEFWFEFASTYSYLSVMRIAELARDAGVEIVWRPFLLGPIFKAQGWDNSPFNLFPAKGRYMFRDIERVCQARGLTFQMPDPFPVNGLQAARIALRGTDEPWISDFVQAVFTAQFADHRNISKVDVLANILKRMGLDARDVFEKANADDNKLALRAQTERAAELHIFGAPTFITSDGELFWGDDRLEQALSWAASGNIEMP